MTLLKQLCETRRAKDLSWQTKAAASAGVPQRFTLECSVAILANDWLSRGVHAEAILDRGHKILFDPSADEVHAYVATWFEDREIFEFVEEHLHLIERPSIREVYLLAQERKSAGRRPDGSDWKDYILKHTTLRGPALLVARILADPQYTSTQAMERAFIEQGGGCRSTFYEHARQLRARAACLPLLRAARHSDSFMRCDRT